MVNRLLLSVVVSVAACTVFVMIKRIKNLLQLTTFFGAIVLAIMAMSEYSTTEIVGNVKIIDGDSLRIDGEEVRLRWIDAPEFTQTCTNAQNQPYKCGLSAKKHLAQLIKNQDVQCIGSDYDKYERFLASCFVGDININETMVKQGWAVSFGNFEDEEQEASALKVGLWAGDFQRPSDWRRDDQSTHSRGFLSSILGW